MIHKKLIALAVLASLSTATWAQSRLTGTITDDQGEPIIGATIVVQGSKKGATSDLSGHFSISDLPDHCVLQVTYVGFKTQTIDYHGQQQLNVRMREDAKALNEVVVVGYGVQRKASLTSAISQIKGEEAFKDRGVSSVTVSLQGEVPGLTVTRTSTRPGNEGASMKIRGDISINGNSEPLIIIDGITSSLDEFNSLNSADVDNISVLKDASAAIYGARAAAGVVLVTTKHGKKGRANITYNGSFSRTIDGIQAPMTNNKEWLDMFYEAQYNDAMVVTGLTDPEEIHKNINWWIFNSFGGATLDQTDIDPATGAPRIYKGETLFNALREGKTLTLQNGNKVERWEPNNYLMDFLYGQANQQKHNISISGADDRFSYRLSLGYEKAQSQLKVAEDGQKKWSARLNADYQATRDLKLETNLSYERRKVVTPNTDVGAGWMDPWFWAVYNENGDPYDTFSGNRNPVGGLKNGGQNTFENLVFRGRLQATYSLNRLLKGLSLVANGAYKRAEYNYQYQQNKVQYYDWVGTQTGNKRGPGSLRENTNRYDNLNLGAFLNYNQTFGGKHAVFAMLGVTGEQEKYKGITAARNLGPIYEGSGLKDLNVYVSGANNTANGGQSEWSLLSYLTRMNYAYDNRYSVEFLARRDGSSKLVSNQRWKNFYSVSGYWRISEEKFMQSLTWLNDLKLRYNYGKTGSVEGIGNYESYASISTGTSIFGVNPATQTTLSLSGMTSSQRTWETIDSHDIGLDFSLLNNRLRGSFDYFIRTNNGMFISVDYPSVLGATAPKVNDGKMRAKGWEFQLDWNDHIGDLKYHVGFQLSDAWSKVLELTNNENVPYAGINQDRLIGKPRRAIYVYKTDGLFKTQEEVDAYYEKYYWNADHTGPKPNNILPMPAERNTGSLRPGARKVVDLDGDGAITRDDIYYAGDAAPRLNFGIKLGLEWKGIDFSAFFQGVGKQKVLRNGNFYAPWVTNYVMQNKTFMGKMWSYDNPDAEYAIASRNNGFSRWNYENKDVSVQDNKYIRLKSLVIGYTLPEKWTKTVSLSKVRVYFAGDDLWEATKVKDGYDPEYGEASNNTFPFSRLLTFGIDVTF
jgi:TonB-linked SusC/RagA family outer membrane protein